ncbi:NADPH-dependent FMN reductase [Pelovirga terrestris]|uniref:NAD(P)H-dependent oxidoreductase n=1 Tax=Pelovirga terrestris TaxID=2771352 RepID=A0A8J6QN45_9BACT|nr:NADPH-dependent FMN reductase [Pelovirga terrestris]MBD1400013.1 NAD(P)H-dependent oxidoreductase [Pelovirga terrestris]
MEAINVLGISGSLRKASTNRGLLRWAQNCAPEGMQIETADLSEIPFFNADHQHDQAEAVLTLMHQAEGADALLLACPEYNYSLAPALKNALDWLSRAPDNHLLAGKPVAIMSSGGGQGGARAQYHLRQVCVYLNLHPLNKPEIFCHAFGSSFDPQGNLVDDKIQKQIRELLAALADWHGRIRR